MGQWGTWDIVLWGAAAYLALALLVRMMLRRRNELLDEVRQQLTAERQRRAREAKAKGKSKPPQQPRGRNAA